MQIFVEAKTQSKSAILDFRASRVAEGNADVQRIAFLNGVLQPCYPPMHFRCRKSSNVPRGEGMRQLAGIKTKYDEGSRPMPLVPDSTTRSVSEGILGENQQPQPLADASGYKVSAIGLTPLRAPDSFVAAWTIELSISRNAACRFSG